MGTYITVRKIDELGRIVLPIEVRKKCEWDIRDSISISYGENNTLILGLAEKYTGAKCVFCGATETAKTINGRDICGKCLEEIAK